MGFLVCFNSTFFSTILQKIVLERGENRKPSKISCKDKVIYDCYYR